MNTETPPSTVVFRSTDPLGLVWPYFAVAGGSTFAMPQDGMVRRRYHEHTLILTLSGAGRVMIEGGTFACQPNSLTWLDTGRKYAHGAALGQHWQYLWIAVSGFGLDDLHARARLSDQPVTNGLGTLAEDFEDIIEQMPNHQNATDGRISGQIAMVLAALFTGRQSDVSAAGLDPISKIMHQMRMDVSRDWDVDGLAALAGLSASQLFRRFKEASGTSPVQWLRQERMRLARHLLTATTDPVATIAQRCGYSDPYYFSRDFKRLNDLPPGKYRASTRQ